MPTAVLAYVGHMLITLTQLAYASLRDSGPGVSLTPASYDTTPSTHTKGGRGRWSREMIIEDKPEISGLAFLVGNSFPSDSKKPWIQKAQQRFIVIDSSKFLDVFSGGKRKNRRLMGVSWSALKLKGVVDFFVFQFCGDVKNRKSTKMVEHQTKLNHQFINERHILEISYCWWKKIPNNHLGCIKPCK